MKSKQFVGVTVDAEILAKIQKELDEKMIPVSRYFNKLMIDDYQRRNKQRTLENFKEVI